MRAVRRRSLPLVVIAVLAAAPARAAEPAEEPDLGSDLEEEAFGTRGQVRTRAEAVSFDARERSVELSGNVRIDSPPFHLRSQRIKLTRTRWGIEAEGDGRLAFCPCLGTPVTIEFDKAIVAPPGELILRNPKLEIYRVPVMYLPWFWMRSDEKVGLLPPDIAYRGQDGLFVGEGVHLPWKDRDARQALDLRGGVYSRGGFVADARLRSPIASTKIRYDRLVGSNAPATLPSGPADVGARDEDADQGLVVDARGADHQEVTTIAWDADVIRGRRGLVATSDLDAAAKPWDRAAFSGALRLHPVVTETGVRAVTRRGRDLTALEASGPFLAVRSSGAALRGVVYDATIEGGALRVSGSAVSPAALAPPSIAPDTVSYARAEVGATAATTFGPVRASMSGRAAGDVAAEGRRSGADRAATAGVRVALPMARAFRAGDAGASADGRALDDNDPLVHVIEPFLGGSVLHADGDAILGSLPGRGLASIAGTAPITDAGVRTTFGRWGRRESLELAVSGGAAYGTTAAEPDVRPLARGRLAATLPWLGAQLETGHVAGGAGTNGGGALVARLRLGLLHGPRVLANVATREGIDPVLSRALTDAATESPAGFLAREGTTGGVGLVVPWARALSTSVAADADATSRELVAARAGFELTDRCNCVTLRATGSHRIGRSGFDVWLALDFAADR